MRQQILRLFDLQLKQLAVHYDLWNGNGRKRSAEALRTLYCSFVKNVQPKLAIEAGANDASLSLRLRKIVPEARIVAFEANPYNVEHYRSKTDFEAERIEYVGAALARENGNLTFHIRTSVAGVEKPRLTGQSSILRRTDPMTTYETVTVDAITLDSFFAGQVAKDCVLWVDVEGATGEVLSGANRIIDDASVVFVEVEERGIWEEQWLAKEVMAFMLDRGFVPVARDFEYRHQYNLLFVRDSVMDEPEVRVSLDWFYSTVVNVRAPTSPHLPYIGGAGGAFMPRPGSG